MFYLNFVFLLFFFIHLNHNKKKIPTTTCTSSLQPKKKTNKTILISYQLFVQKQAQIWIKNSNTYANVDAISILDGEACVFFIIRKFVEILCRRKLNIFSRSNQNTSQRNTPFNDESVHDREKIYSENVIIFHMHVDVFRISSAMNKSRSQTFLSHISQMLNRAQVILKCILPFPYLLNKYVYDYLTISWRVHQICFVGFVFLYIFISNWLLKSFTWISIHRLESYDIILVSIFLHSTWILHENVTYSIVLCIKNSYFGTIASTMHVSAHEFARLIRE